MRSQIKLIGRIPLYWSYWYFNFPKPLPFNYTFLISTKCNSRCKTCNIWKENLKDLNLAEWKKIFQSLDNSPFWVTVSGGEPFLQPHLYKMVILLDKICHPAIINIPTNSLLVDKIEDQVKKILKKVKAQLVINLSLDGIGEEHDRIRGIRGNFKKVMQNYHNLKKLQKKYSNLTVGFGTVISRQNIKTVDQVFDFVFKLEPGQYVTEIAEERVELNNLGSNITPSFDGYSKIIDQLLKKMRDKKFKGIGRISRAFRFEYYQFVKDWLLNKNLLPDYAGFASCEITSTGDIWPSCIKGEKMGNLRKVNYHFPTIWFSIRGDQLRKEIKKEGSSYPLANAFYSSALHHPPTLLKILHKIIWP